MRKAYLFRRVGLVAAVIAVVCVLAYAVWRLQREGPPAGDANPVARALDKVVKERPMSIKDRAGIQRLLDNKAELRKTASENPEQALQLLEHGKPTYVVEIAEGIVASGNPNALERLGGLVCSGEIELRLRELIIAGIVPEELKGEARRKAGELLLRLAGDTGLAPSLREHAVRSLCGNWGEFVTENEEVQEFLLRAFSEGRGSGHSPFRLAALRGIGMGIPWNRAGRLLLGTLEAGEDAPTVVEDELILSLSTRFTRVASDYDDEKAKAFMPTGSEANRLVDATLRYIAAVGEDARRRGHGVTLLSQMAALLPGRPGLQATEAVLGLGDETGLLDALTMGAATNARLYQADVLERAVQYARDRSVRVGGRETWMAVLSHFVDNESVPAETIEENRRILKTRLPSLLDDETLTERSRARLKRLVKLCEKPVVRLKPEELVAPATRLQELLAAESRSFDAYVDIATHALSRLDLLTAQLAFKKALEVEPGSTRALHLKAMLTLVPIPNWKKTTDILDKLLKLDPKFADAYGERAYCQARLREYDKAIADGEKATGLDSKNPVSFIGWGMAAFGKRQFALAAEKFGLALELYGGPVEESFRPEAWVQRTLIKDARLGLAAALFTQDEFDKASKHLRGLMEGRSEVTATYLLWLYMCERNARDAASARTAVKGTMEGKKEVGASKSAKRFLAVLLEETDDDKVAEFLRELRESRAPWGGDGAYLAGKLLQAGGEEELARNYFEKAAKTWRGYFFASILAGNELAKERPGN